MKDKDFLLLALLADHRLYPTPTQKELCEVTGDSRATFKRRIVNWRKLGVHITYMPIKGNLGYYCCTNWNFINPERLHWKHISLN